MKRTFQTVPPQADISVKLERVFCGGGKTAITVQRSCGKALIRAKRRRMLLPQHPLEMSPATTSKHVDVFTVATQLCGTAGS